MAFPRGLVIPPDVLETAACTKQIVRPRRRQRHRARAPAVTAAPIVSTARRSLSG